MEIIIKNLSKKKALELLKNVQNSVCKGLAIQGKYNYEYVNCDTCLARIAPNKKFEDDSDMEFPDFNNFHFTIQSGYWTESTLKEYAGI